MNYAIQTSTRVSPAFLNYDRHPPPVKSLWREVEHKGPKVRISTEVWVDRVKRMDVLQGLVTRNLESAHQRQYYNKGCQDVQFQVGDMVMRKAHVLLNSAQKLSAKLAPDWVGPYEIIEVKPQNVYMLSMGNGRKNPMIHVKELMKYREGRVTGGKMVAVVEMWIFTVSSKCSIVKV